MLLSRTPGNFLNVKDQSDALRFWRVIILCHCPARVNLTSNYSPNLHPNSHVVLFSSKVHPEIKTIDFASDKNE